MNPSAWIERFGPSVSRRGPVVDVACGGGRHTRWFSAQGFQVYAIDRDVSAVSALAGEAGVHVVELDLEQGEPVPLARGSCGAVVVTNYLWRPILDELVTLLAPGGWLLYETFAAGNERYGRPTNPDFLLRPGELLDLAARHDLRVVAYEDVVVDEPRPACVQRIAARARVESSAGRGEHGREHS
jgi:SAM-dependent methyltransferase